VKLNELNLSHVLGDYGAAAIKQVGNRLIPGNTEGNLSVQDKIAKDKFIADFIGRASTNLNSAIQSGLVDPKIKANPIGGNAGPAQGGQTPPGAPSGATPPASAATPTPPGSTTPPASAATPTPPGQAPGGPKTPEQIRKEKQATAGQVAQQQMAANPAPAKPGAPTAPTQQAPAQQAKMTPQQVAALKGRLKAGATPTSGQSGFKNYVGGSGERMTGVDKSGAPVFQKIQRESKYSKLDYILESIINIDEAQEAQSISEYLQNMFNQYLGIPITDPKAKVQVKTLADMAQASYPKMKDALTKMANLGFAISYSQGSGATQDANAGATASQPSSGASAFSQGMQKGLGGSTSSASEPTSASDTDAETAAKDKEISQRMTSLQGQQYDKVMSIVSKLSKDEKQQLLTSLTKPETSTAPEAPASNAGAGAFDQMSKQLQQPKSTANPVDTRQQKLNVDKIKSGNKGAPTPDEEAKLQQRIQQQLAKQA
jgi:hypothetical protein